MFKTNKGKILMFKESTKFGKKCNESKYGKGPWPTWVVKDRLVQLIEGVPEENPMRADLVEILEKYYGSMDAEKLMGERVRDSYRDDL